MLYSNTNKSDIENIDKTMTLKKKLEDIENRAKIQKNYQLVQH